ncbi:TPA: hypothetical protein ACH3X2_007997 [Trebouxia sp. C0005]
MEARVGARQQGDFPAQNRSSGIGPDLTSISHISHLGQQRRRDPKLPQGFLSRLHQVQVFSPVPRPAASSHISAGGLQTASGRPAGLANTSQKDLAVLEHGMI